LAGSYRFLNVQITAGIAVVTLTRSPVNAVNQEMYEEIRALFAEIAIRDAALKCVILTGQGKHFCAGNDLDEFMTMTPKNAGSRMFEVREAFWAVRDCPIPVIAAVNGAALGTGLALAASCDFIIAAQNARFGLPEISVGVMGGAKHLRRLVPEPMLRWMFLSGESAPASLLLGVGAIIDIVPPEDLLPAAKRRAGEICRHSGVALRIGKRTLNRIEQMDLEAGYEFEQARTGQVSGYADSAEARQAVVERRSPKYRDAPEDVLRATEIALE
jgi:enoyl-CoA hydratase